MTPVNHTHGGPRFPRCQIAVKESAFATEEDSDSTFDASQILTSR